MKYFIRLLHKHSIELNLQKNIPTKQRNNDRCVVHDILSMTSLISLLTGMNTCRMHIQVTFMSELTNNTSNILSPSAFGENKCYRKRSNLQWSTQHNPDKQTCYVGKEMVTIIYCRAENVLFLRSNMRVG